MIYKISDHEGVTLKNKGINFGFFSDGNEVTWDNFFECAYNAECWRRKFQYEDFNPIEKDGITTLKLIN